MGKRVREEKEKRKRGVIGVKGKWGNRGTKNINSSPL
jgi:hypothetical protein